MIGVVEKIINGGWGIVREHDKIVFLSYVLPNENVEYEIKDKAKGIYWGKTLNILSPSQFRKKQECSLYGECGGCIFQHIDYEYQKTIKTNIFKDDMQRIGGMSIDIDNFFDSPPYKYRVRGRLKAENTGKIGFIKKGTHNIIPINNCLLFSNEMNDYLSRWNTQTTPPFFFQQDILLNRNKNEKKIFSHLSHPPKKKSNRKA
jgi:23S rRNA (uracil1939-C5)-methyltransferase